MEEVPVNRAQAPAERRVAAARAAGKRRDDAMDAAEETAEPLLDQSYLPGSNASATPLMQ